MKTIIVLAMHGSPPNDFPKSELIEFFGLHARMEAMPEPARKGLEARYSELEEKIRAWPRTNQNDPFYFASQELAKALQSQSGSEVLVGFNEFCKPTLDESLNAAIQKGAEKVVVVTPMMTPGGEHSEKDIPAAIDKVKQANPQIEIQYAWPFELSDVAKFLTAQIEKTK
jgi:sirohydrochlorin cobaltochelatase